MSCVCATTLNRDYSTVAHDLLQLAEPVTEILNEQYFRMFSVLMKKISRKLAETEPMRISSETDFAFIVATFRCNVVLSVVIRCARPPSRSSQGQK